MKSAVIMEIQRFCIHDGPGIRTTVFLKGCHMKCNWCHNPESQSIEPEMMFFEDSCINCGECEKICIKKAHSFTEGNHTLKVDLCKNCSQLKRCQSVCCTQSMKVCGTIMSVDEVIREIMKDKKCYGENGGVTFSGGEPLLQHEFLIEAMKGCRQEGISVCLDTTLNIDWNIVEDINQFVDIYLIDIKSMDEEQHIALTGRSNKRLLSNITRLSEQGAKMLLRMPILENINDSEKEMKKRRMFLEKISGIEQIDMMAVMNYGKAKYKALGRDIPVINCIMDQNLLVERARKRYEESKED